MMAASHSLSHVISDLLKSGAAVYVSFGLVFCKFVCLNFLIIYIDININIFIDIDILFIYLEFTLLLKNEPCIADCHCDG